MNHAPVREVPKAERGAVVVAAKRIRLAARLAPALIAVLPCFASAAILPEDRADVMYHGYDGGGLEVSGPSVLVRKGFNDKVSVWGNYYMDMISSASIDVVATASPYDETRKEYSGGIDYLSDKTMMGFAYIRSEEDDYLANTARFGISQDFFGDLTTLGISYARGWNDVMMNGDPTFKEHTTRQDWRVDLSQIITPNLVLNFGYEGITDDGYLHDPYRSARYLDPTSAKGFSYESEVTPGTKTSSAWAIRGMYYPAVSCIDARRVSLLQRYVGCRRLEHRVRLRSTAVLWGDAGPQLSLLHAGPARFLQRPVSRIRTRRTSSAATKSCRRFSSNSHRHRADVRVRIESRAVLQAR